MEEAIRGDSKPDRLLSTVYLYNLWKANIDPPRKAVEVLKVAFDLVQSMGHFESAQSAADRIARQCR